MTHTLTLDCGTSSDIGVTCLTCANDSEGRGIMAAGCKFITTAVVHIAAICIEAVIVREEPWQRLTYLHI